MGSHQAAADRSLSLAGTEFWLRWAAIITAIITAINIFPQQDLAKILCEFSKSFFLFGALKLNFSVHQLLITLALLVSALATPGSAQRTDPRKIQQAQKKMQEQMRAAAANQPQLPSDPVLLNLHKEFIVKAEKLAVEYERKKDFEKAREVYESLIRLVPKYGAAEAGLNRVLSSQRAQDRKLANVSASQAWQDSGVTLREGMPVQIEVKGSWKVVFETGPAGLEIPQEFRPKDNRIKLGTLIGIVANNPAELAESQPFVITGGMSFNAKRTGRLYLRMFDLDPSDNEGSLYVLIQSTFAQ